jgi:hypothetical protein
VVPNGSVQDAKIRAKVEDIMVSVASPAQAAAAAGAVAAGGDGVLGPLGPGFGGAEGPVPHRFRVLFGRSAKALKEWAAARGQAGGEAGAPPTQSDLARAGFDAGREPWLSAADYSWDEGLGEGPGDENKSA